MLDKISFIFLKYQNKKRTFKNEGPLQTTTI